MQNHEKSTGYRREHGQRGEPSGVNALASFSGLDCLMEAGGLGGITTAILAARYIPVAIYDARHTGPGH